MALLLYAGHAVAQGTRAPPPDFRPLLPPDDVPFDDSPVASVSPILTAFPSIVPDPFTAPPFAPDWVAEGPSPIFGAQVENIETSGTGTIFNDAAGPIHIILVHPDDENLVFVGTVNGGIWRTTNATVRPPSWEPLTDTQRSLSIGALDLDPLDPLHQTLVAGFGRTSSFGGYGGRRAGLIRSTDLGDTWSVVGPNMDDPGFTDGLRGANIAGLAARGTIFVVAVDDHDTFVTENIGVFRSVDNGVTFDKVSGLPEGIPRGFATDPNDPQTLYAGMVPAFGAVNRGIFRSTDTGATWSKISNSTVDNIIQDAFGGLGTRTIAIAPGTNGQLFVGIVNADTGSGTFVDRLATEGVGFPGIFRTPDGGATWQYIDFPGTLETDPAFDPPAPVRRVFLNPAELAFVEPGQGTMHYALLAHPFLADLVFMGGERQPHLEEVARPLPPSDFINSLGAKDFSGRIFRLDQSLPSDERWQHLTNRPITAFTSDHPGGVQLGGTSNASSPHADARDLAIDLTNDLLEADDGGLYRQTSPETRFGKWVSMNGNLQIAELHRAEWSRASHTIVGATVSNGVVEQVGEDGTIWRSLTTAVGGGLAVENQSSLQVSFRYSCLQNFGSFRLGLYDTGNNLVFQGDPLNVEDVNASAGITDFAPQFITPIAPNVIDTCRVAFAGDRRVFVMEQRGVTAGNQTQPVISVVPTSVGDIKANAIRFGGKADDGMTMPGVLYVAAGNQLLFADIDPTPPVDIPLTPVAPLPGGVSSDEIRDIAIDPDNYQRVFAVTASDVLFFDAAAGSWSVLTGNLTSMRDFHTVEYIPCAGTDALAVGSDLGVFVSLAPNFTLWDELGQDLPNAPVFDLDFDVWVDVANQVVVNRLVAGTLGRGAFIWKDVCSTVSDGAPLLDTMVDFVANNTCIVESMTGFGRDELGNAARPFTTLQAAVDAALSGSRVVVRSGQTSETLTITKPVTIVAAGGPVRIGAP